MIRDSTEWRKHMEANSSLMKRFDESRVELEKSLKLAQNCLSERGNPEELLKRHTVGKSLSQSMMTLQFIDHDVCSKGKDGASVKLMSMKRLM